jgi:hypothetical protein
VVIHYVFPLIRTVTQHELIVIEAKSTGAAGGAYRSQIGESGL